MHFTIPLTLHVTIMNYIYIRILVLPNMVMDGLSLPSSLNKDSLGTLPNGSFGLGSDG